MLKVDEHDVCLAFNKQVLDVGDFPQLQDPNAHLKCSRVASRDDEGPEGSHSQGCPSHPFRQLGIQLPL